MKRKSVIIAHERRVGYYGVYYVILPDHASGRRRRFTVYKMPASPSRRTKIVGRELTLGYAIRLVKRLENK